jgi:transposase
VGTLHSMRGNVESQSAVVMVNPEAMIPSDHPIRVIKKIVDEVLDRIGPQLEAIYAKDGRPSTPPETLLKAQILIALYTVRSERLFCERLRYDFLFRWFLDLRDALTTFDPTTFSKNRERLLKAEIFDQFFEEVVEEARRRRLLSDEHFTVDGTMIEANASLKSFRKKDGGNPPRAGGSNPEVNFRGEKRKNDTHESTTDPESRLYRKGNGQPAQLCYLGHVLMREPQWAVHRCGPHDCFRSCRAGGRAGDGAAIDRAAPPPRHAGSRQRIRPGNLSQRTREARSGAAYRTDRRNPSADRPADDRAERISNQPAKAKASGRDFRMGEDGRRNGQDTLPRRGACGRAVRNDHERVQPGPNGPTRIDRHLNDRPKRVFPSPSANNRSRVERTNSKIELDFTCDPV